MKKIDFANDNGTTDSLVIYDRTSRRQFIRTGTAFVLAGGSAAFSHASLASDCDRAGNENKPKQAGNGSDSDSGSEADPEGCGRNKDKPKITRYRSRQNHPEDKQSKPISVAKVVG